MKSKYHFSFEDLKVYQKAIDFGEMVFQQASHFPKDELFGLTAQFKRAADSIALNIAEGATLSDSNFNRYLKIAWGSARECVSISTKARLRNYITFEKDEENRKSLTEISKMISSLQKYLESNDSKV